MSSECIGEFPPPPPPPFPSPTTKKQKTNEFNSNTLCKWAKEYGELQAACSRYQICHSKHPYKFRFTHFPSILQDGPCCGLIAISILSKGKLTPINLLKKAQELKFTNNGEMFSVRNMFNLMQGFIEEGLLDNCKIALQNGPLLSVSTIEDLINGAILLVPYDADFNHSPCLKQGHKAHWALVTGILIADKTENCLENPENVFIFAKQGKSLHLGVWSLKQLSDSNGNLVEFSPQRESDSLEYVLPEGGISGVNGLNRQFILVKFC